MSRILVVGEDALCCALGEKIVNVVLPNWELAAISIDAKGVTKLFPRLSCFADQAQYVQPVFCIADTDKNCPVDIVRRWRPVHASPDFVFRLAVTEVESWILADRTGFSSYFHTAANKIPAVLDELADPKSMVLTLVSRSKRRIFRDEVVSASDLNKRGSGYNVHLKNFIKNKWDANNAVEHSPSLLRAINNLRLVLR